MVVLNSDIVCIDVFGDDGDGVTTAGMSFVVFLDGASLLSVTASPLVLYNVSDGGHVVRVVAVDAAGNADPSPWNVSLFAVTTPPTTAFAPTRLPVSLTNQSLVSFGVVGNSSVSGIGGLVSGFSVTWSADGVGLPVPIPPQSGVVPIAIGSSSASETVVAVSNLTSGTYHVIVRAVDVVENEDPTGKSATIVVDQLPPTALWTGDQPTIVNVSTLLASASASDSQSPVTWLVRLDGGDWMVPAALAQAVVFTNVTDGSHDVQCAAVDAAGNFQVPPYDHWSVFVDTHPPAVSFTHVPERYTQDGSVQLCVVTHDMSAVDVTLIIDGGAPAAMDDSTGCAALVVTVDGNHSAVVLAVDAAGNAAVPLSTWWVLDRSPPLVNRVMLVPTCHSVSNVTVCSISTSASVLLTCVATPAGIIQSPCIPEWQLALLQRTSATAACDDGNARRQLSLTGASAGNTSSLESWTSAVDPSTAFTPAPLPVDGQYELTTRAFDAAGNVGPSQGFVWWLDTAAPDAPTLVSSPGSIVFTAAVTFRLQLRSDNSPGQTSFWYTVEPAIAGAPVGLTQVPQLPMPNSAIVLLTVTTSAKDTPYTLKVWSVDQGGLMSR